MKNMLYTSLFSTLFSIGTYAYVRPEKWLLILFILSYSSLVYSIFKWKWSNPKLLPKVEFNKVYRFYGTKGKRLLLKEINMEEIVAYDLADIVISSSVSKDNYWCELIVKPGQRRLESAC